MAIIKDGQAGYTAGVSSDNRLLTESVSHTEISQVSRGTGAAFNVHGERTIASGGTFEKILHIKYTGEKLLIIDHIMFSREDTALASSGQAIFEVLGDVSYTSGGAAITIHPMNYAQQTTLTATAYSGSTTLVLDTTNELEIMDFAVTNTHTHNFRGALVLGKNDEFGIIGKSLNTGDILHAAMFVYEVSA